jgi:hypothetical protein
MAQIQLRTIAYSRSGDKGDLSNVIVAPFDENDYEWLGRHLTVDVVREHFKLLVKGSITRYEMPGTRMFNFVMEKALQGGVSRSINIDMHGKSRASLMLGIELETGPEDPPPSMQKESKTAVASARSAGN